jgi:hypothetical protein
MVIDRWSGLALDSTPSPVHRTRPVLWTPHGLVWQQWRLERVRGELVRVVSEGSGLLLTTDRVAGDGSWVWLERDRDRNDQMWRLRPTEDRAAFVVETAISEHALDAGQNPRLPASGGDHSISDPTSPHMWGTHWAPWQQWMIVRLPLT